MSTSHGFGGGGATTKPAKCQLRYGMVWYGLLLFVQLAGYLPSEGGQLGCCWVTPNSHEQETPLLLPSLPRQSLKLVDLVLWCKILSQTAWLFGIQDRPSRLLTLVSAAGPTISRSPKPDTVHARTWSDPSSKVNLFFLKCGFAGDSSVGATMGHFREIW